MSIISSLPYTLTNGSTADASQVMANFTQIYNNVNNNAATAGANSSITSLTGLTTPLSAAQGGTGNSSPTANCVAIGEGTSAAFNFVGPGTSGQALVSNGTGADPSFQSINTVPSGAMMMWPTASVPSGWLEANGQSTTGYPNLVSIYGSTLPDMRGYFPRGWDHSRGLDPNTPSLLQTVTDQFKSHSHTVTDPQHQHGSTAGQFVTAGSSGGSYGAGSNGLGVSATALASTGISINNTGGTETAPKYMAWMFIIKT